jgi:hypothetical protein
MAALRGGFSLRARNAELGREIAAHRAILTLPSAENSPMQASQLA